VGSSFRAARGSLPGPVSSLVDKDDESTIQPVCQRLVLLKEEREKFLYAIGIYSHLSTLDIPLLPSTFAFLSLLYHSVKSTVNSDGWC
jgi:hypothetical protein